MKNSLRILLPTVLCAATLVAPSTLRAATFGWSGSGVGPGTGANTAWLTTGGVNWTNLAFPGSADLVFFGAAGSGTSIGINFNGAPAGSTNLGAIVLGGGSTVDRTIGNSANTASIATRLYLSGIGGGLITNAVAGRTLTLAPYAGGSLVAMTNVLVNSGVIEAVGNIVISANIIEAGGARDITKTGTGTLTLNGTNTQTGKMFVLAGTLAIGDENRLGTNPAASSADTLTLNGGTLTATAALTIDDANRGITLGANHGNLAGSQSITLSRPIVGPGNLTNNSTGTLILNRTDNTYSGRTILRAGVTRAINGNSFGALPGAYVADQIIFENNSILLNQDSEFNLEANRGITINSTGGRLQSGFSRPWGINSVIAGSGILTISSDPTPAYVRLNAANTFTNELIVNNSTAGAAWGLVAVHGSLAAGGLVRVTTNGWLLGTGTINRNVMATNGATIGGGEISTPGTLTINGSLSLTNAILAPDEAVPGTIGSGVNDLLQVNGNLNLAGVVTVRPTALFGSLAAGTYRLINYTGALTGSAANLAADADGYTVVFDTSTPGQVNMTVSGGPTTVVWKGTAGPLNAPLWDVATTPNWAAGMTTTTFVQNQAVLFDNTGIYSVGAVPLPINMVGPFANFSALFPASVTVSTTNTVTLNGASVGKLSGGMALTNRGPGLLALTTANGNFPNDYTGPTVAEGGLLRAGYARAFGATNGPTIATSGGTIDVNAQSLGAEPFIASGSGVSNNGAIVNLSGTGQNNALRHLTLAGDTTVGGVGRWDVRNYANNNNWPAATVAGGGYSLIKTGANQVSFVDVGNTDLGDLVIQQGTLQFEGDATLGRTGASDEITVMPGATLGLWGSRVFSLKYTRLNNNARIFKDNGTTTNDGPVTLLGGAAIIDVANNGGNLYQLRNVVDGAGGLAKVGAGILQLAGTNTYSGPTVVSNGTLAILTNGSIANSVLVDVKSGAVLDVGTLVTPFTLGSGQTLSGAGSIIGRVVANPGSSVLPGTSPGTLSINSNLTLNGASLTYELNTATTEGGGVNDLINARDLTLAGLSTLNIVPLTPLTAGSPYTLFRYTNTLTGGAANLNVISGSRYTFTVDTSAANLVRLTPAGAAGSLVWAGGTAGSETLWDVNTTANWLNGVPPDTFRHGDAVTFDNASAFNSVSLVGALSPGTITFNNTVDYTLGGSGELKTLSTLNKSGTGRVTIANNNPEMNGGATISAGILQIGNGGTSGGIGPVSALTNNATLVHSRSDSNGLPNVIRGSGTVVKEGAGTLALAGANQFTGPITVNNGTLRAANAGAFGNTVGITVNNGGQVDLAGVTPTVRSNNYFLAGNGPDGRGALINSGVSVSGNSGITNVTLTADASIGLFGPDASSFGRFDIGSGVNPLTSLLNANNFALTKLGPGALNIRVVAANFPTLIVSNGVVYGEGLDFNLATNITVHAGGQIGMFGTYRTNSSSLTLNAGATVVNVGGSGTNVWTGPVTNLGASTVNVTGLSGNGHVQFGNNLYGSAPLSVIGGNNRAVELRTNNDATFSGPWIIAASTLLRTLENGTPGPGTITNLGTIEWFTTNAATLAQGIYGSPANGVFRHHAGAGALTFGGAVSQNFIHAQNGDLAKPMTFAAGANIQSANISVGITNFGPASGSARLNIDPGASVTVGSFFLGDQNTQTGVVVQAGSTVVITNQFRLSHWPNNVSTYTLDSGSITMALDPAANPSGAAEQNGGFYIGIDGVGVLNQNGGTITTPNLVFDNRASSVLAPNTNTYNLNGGTLVLGRWGIQSPNSTYQINLGGGTIESSANWTSVLRMTLTGTNGDVAFNPAAGRTNLLGGILSGPAGLVKNGAGTLFLTNAGNDIAGNVTVNNGTLSGNGILGGNLDVMPGGTLAPGASPGIIAATNGSLGGTMLMEVSRTGLTLTTDRLVVIDTITFGGALLVTNIGQSIIGGEVFDLFDWVFSSGTFTSVTLPPLSANLAWDTSTLYVDGIIRVVGTPTIALAPITQTVYVGDNARFAAQGTNMNPFTVQWSKDGLDLIGATGNTLALTNVTLADAGVYSFCVSNSFGGNCASATLTVLPVTNLLAGLIAYWPLDDFDAGNNRTVDATANLQHLGGIGIQSSNVIAGVRGNAFNFNGAASNFVARIHTGGEALPAYNYPACTVAMWVKGSYVGQADRRVFVESSTNNNNPLFGIGTHSGGTGPEVDIYIRNNDGGNPVNHLRGRLPAFDGNWHHIAFVDNNGNTTLYVDGQVDTNINYARGTMTLNAVALAGLLRGTYGVGFIGSLDDTMVWRRALGSNEVYCAMTNSLNGPPVITQQPVGLTLECSSNATFTVAGTSLDTIRYQWYLDGSPIFGATAATFAFATTATSPGNYSVVLSNCVGAVTSAVVALTIQDTIAPAFTCPANSLVQCDGNVPAVNLLSVTVSDACDANPVLTHVSDVASGACPKLIVRTYRATDASGNTNDCAQTITVHDTIQPSITCPPGLSVQCDSLVPVANFAGGFASDNCTPTPVVMHVSDVASGVCPKVIIRTYRATDACGNTNDCAQTITVHDTTPPTITCVPGTTVQCDVDVPTPDFTGGFTSDNCTPGSVVVTHVGDAAIGTCPKTITRTWRATDACGNTNDCVQIFTVHDTTAPMPTCPAPLSVQCPAGVPAPNVLLVSVTDNCDSSPVVTFVGDSSSGVNPTILTRTYRATDFCGNTNDCAQIITVLDTTAPIITTCATSIIVVGDTNGNVLVPDKRGQVVATDNCDIPSITQVPAPGTMVSTGVHVLTFTAIDSANNTSACTATLTVVAGSIPPTFLAQPMNATVECSSNATFTVSVDGTAPFGYQWYFETNAITDATNATLVLSAVTDANEGSYSVIVTNEGGSITSSVVTLTVVDTRPPLITCPAPVTVQCDADVPVASFAGGSVLDGCDTMPVVTHVSDVAAGSCPKVITRTYRATDASGNTNDCAQIITINDITPPTLVCPAPVNVQCDADVPAVNTSSVMAADNCGVTPTVTHVADATSGTCPKVITRTYRATDSCGNTNDCVQIITIIDTTPPTLVCPAAVTVPCDTDVPAVNLGSVTAADNCGAAPTVTHVGDATNGACPKIITRTYRATDTCGNTNDCAQIITIHDTAPPTLACPLPVTVECDADVPAVNTGSVTAADNCGVVPTVTHVSDTSSGTCPRIITRTYRATDACGNTNDCAQIITVRDTIPPVLTCSPNRILKSASTNGANVSFTVTATDNCTASPGVVCVPASGSLFPIGANSVVCTASDACGNTNGCGFTVTVFLAAGTNIVVNEPVPDIPSLGQVSVLNVASPIGSLSDVNVTLNISNGWNGDLFAYLVHESGYAVLLNRVGKTGSNPLGYSDAGLNVRLDDQATNDIHTYRLSLFGNHGTPLAGALTNSWQPDGRAEDPALVLDTTPRTDLLSAFNGMNPNGEWVLFVEDDATGDISTLVSWGLELCGTLGVSPTITAPPQNVAIACGSNAVFNVTATGTGPIGYHWRRNGVPIPGANAATYAINNARPTDNATYSVIVSNAFGSVTSSATLVVTEPNLPAILTQPQSVTNNVGTTVSLSVAASSCSALSYQWCFGLNPLAGETNATLTILNVQLVNQGGYLVKVSNAGGTTTSAVAVVTVNRPPVAQNNGGATIEGQVLMIQVVKLVANDSDADGDPLTVISVTSTSTNGGSVVLGGGKVTYMPLPSFVGTDRYSYTISDGRGGIATADVEVLVVSGSLPSLNQVALIPTPNGFLIRFAGIPGYSYQIQRAATVTGPWSTITTQTAPLHGIIEYEDVNPPPGTGFYRTVAP